MNMTKYQDQILKDLKNGAKLQCTEGSDYKAWLVYPDGTERKVRRNSAEKVCNENEGILIFGRPDGIAHRKAVQTGSSVAAGVRFSEELKMKKLTIEQRAQNIVDRKDICNDVLLKKYIVRHFELAIKATNDNTAELKPSLYLRNALLGVKYGYERIMKAHNSGNAIVTDDERDNMKNDLLILNELL